MEKINLAHHGDQLVVSRHKAPYFMMMTVWFVALALFPIGSYLSAFVYYKHSIHSLVYFYTTTGTVLPLAFVFLFHGMSYLRPWKYVFDREHNFVTLNGTVVCPLNEVKSVRVDKNGWKGGRISGSILKLSFFTESGTENEVERSSLYGPGLAEMERTGAAIANYIGVELYKPEY